MILNLAANSIEMLYTKTIAVRLLHDHTLSDQNLSLIILIILLQDGCMPTHCSTPLHFDIGSSTCKVFYESVDNGKIFHAFKLKFDDEVSISEAQVITEEIYHKIVVDPVIKHCHVGVFYQTNSTDLVQNPRQTDFTITGIFLTVHAFVFKGNLTARYDMEKNLVAAYISESHASFLTSEVFDPDMLEYRTSGEATLIELQAENFTYFKIGNYSHYFFQNPFDKTAIIGHLDNRFMAISSCDPNVYKEDFLECPSFLYKLEPNFQRVPTGLSVKFRNKKILFPYGEFKTVNFSRVRICKQAVLERTSSLSVAPIMTCHFPATQLHLCLCTITFLLYFP